MNKTLIKLALIVILALGLLMMGCSSKSEPEVAQVGGISPDFKLQSLDGQSVSLSDFKGKPILINFWASWCGPCGYEMPYLQEVYEEWSDKEVVLLAINIGDSSSTVEKFMQDHNLSFPVLLDTKQIVSQKYNIMALPTTFFIGKDGVIQEKIMGAFPNKEEIENRLAKIVT